MCVSLRKISVKSSTLHGVRFAYVPCGHCAECRQQYKSEWSFRLSAELESLKKSGWIIAFGTLTYNKQNLPVVPKSCFLKGERYRRIMCFNRSHVRTFIDSLRKELHKHYGLKGLRYFLGCEFGEHTHRSHYHFLLCWEPKTAVDDNALNSVLDAVTMHRYVCRLWRKGFIFPWTAYGGCDKHGYYHKPFEVAASAFEAAHYAAKYAVKDLALNGHFKGVCLKSSEFRNYQYFHLQSRSLGKALIDSVDDTAKLSYYLHGCQFQAKDRLFALPRYLKKKLLFNPKYVFIDIRDYSPIHRVKDGKRWVYCTSDGLQVKYNDWFVKRLVRRELTDFYKQNNKYIWNKRTSLFEDFFKKFFDYEFIDSLDLRCKDAEKMVYDVRKAIKTTVETFYQGNFNDYVCSIACYIGVPKNFCYRSKHKSLIYLNRFFEQPKYTSTSTIGGLEYAALHDVWLHCNRLLSYRNDYLNLLEKERYINKVNDFIRG